MGWVFYWFLILSLVSCQQSRLRRQEWVDAWREESGSAAAWEQRRVDARFQGAFQPKEKVFIFPFWNDTPIQDVKIKNLGIEEFIAQEFRRGLHLTGRVLISDLSTPLKTENFMSAGQINLVQLLAEGRKLGASLVVIGRVKNILMRNSADEIGFLRKNRSVLSVELEMKLFDLQSSREVLNRVSVGEISQDQFDVLEKVLDNRLNRRNEGVGTAIQEAISDLLKDVVDVAQKKKWQGRIVKRTGAVLFLNAGKETGLMIGDILKASTLGEELFDPVTGASLGRTPGVLKGTLQVKGFTERDGSYAQIHTGEGFQEGDWVELY